MGELNVKENIAGREGYDEGGERRKVRERCRIWTKITHWQLFAKLATLHEMRGLISCLIHNEDITKVTALVNLV